MSKMQLYFMAAVLIFAGLFLGSIAIILFYDSTSHAVTQSSSAFLCSTWAAQPWGL